jgi:enoyl-[acyl-carrier protein] reductase/trans-2-enoyl-CoA reductase (NAD+)
MTERILRPKGTQTLLLDSHPTGCARTVHSMIALTRQPTAAARQPVVLVIGSSAGYGLAATIVSLFTHRASCVGLGYERAATDRRTASAGWYRTRALADAARAVGLRFEPVNGDGFHPDTKQAVLDRLRADFGPVDYLVYSVAAPRRTDPATGATYQSVIKPIGHQHHTKTLAFDDDGTPTVREMTVAAASDDEIAATVKVMGGQDWAAWVDALAAHDLLAPGFKTVALSYIGSDVTAAIYRNGTIGRAKDHLEATAARLDRELATRGGALISVNGAAVTQAATAIPGIGLYASLLRAVVGDAMQPPVRQAIRLWDHLLGATTAGAAELDPDGRLRLDDWELDDSVQAQLRDQWKQIDTANVAALADTGWFRAELRRLYGFDVPGVDYQASVEVDLPWPQ